MSARTCLRPERAAGVRKERPRGRQSGATLIEILVSLLIFSLGVLGLVAMLAKSTATAIDAQDRSRAAVLVDELVAAMWFEGTSSPSILSKWTARVSDATVSGLPNASVTGPTTSTDSTTGIKTVTVTLTWTEPSKSSSNQYSTSVVLP